MPILHISNHIAQGDYAGTRYQAYKLPDYFTSSLPYAQKGDPVKIFGDNALAPVVTGSEHDLRTTGIDGLKFRNSSGTIPGTSYALVAEASTGLLVNASTSSTVGSGEYHPTNLWANNSGS